MFMILLLAGVLLVSCLSLCYIKAYAHKRLLDVPNHRSSHQMPIPRGGGFGIVFAFSIAMLVLFFNDRLDLTRFLAFTTSLLIAGIGFWDDHRHISARWRFLVHVGAALTAQTLIHGFPPLSIGALFIDFGLLGYALGVVYLVWLLNLFNFMDGIDGLAASEAIFVSGALACFLTGADSQLALIALALTASSLGFLLWNWPPAKIFMGDVGSGFLGFVLGLLILMAGFNNPVYFYIGLILVRRYNSGQQWYEAHCSHAYQHAAKRHGHLRVLLSVWAINLCWLLPAALCVYRFPTLALPGFITAYIPLIYLSVKFEAGRA
jgi:Fuc2NAc and GlcNAc transferase